MLRMYRLPVKNKEELQKKLEGRGLDIQAIQILSSYSSLT